MSDYAEISDLVDVQGPDDEDVKLPTGKLVKVRGITRFEYMLAVKNASANGEMDAGVLERHFIRFGMLEPKMKIEDVERWTKTAGNKVFEPVTEAIRRLSGLGQDADKSDVS